MTLTRALTARLLLAGALLSTATGCATTVRTHPAFHERQTRIHTIAALPPAVTAYRLTFKGDQELLPELIDPAADLIISTAEAALKTKGYRVPHLNPRDPELTQNAELRGAIFTVQQVFQQRILELAQRRFPKHMDVSVGLEVNRFADLARADALLLISCEGLKKSGGEIAKDVTKTLLISVLSLGSLVIAYPTAVTVVQMALADGNTGELLWYHSTLLNGRHEFAIDQRDRLTAAVKRLLKPLPNATASRLVN